MRVRDRGVEMGGGDSSELGSVMEGEERKNRGPVSMQASPRTSRTKRKATKIAVIPRMFVVQQFHCSVLPSGCTYIQSCPCSWSKATTE